MNASHPVTVSVFRPESFGTKPQVGTVLRHESWGGVVQCVGRPRVTTDKASEGGFVVADLRDGIRRKTHVLSNAAMGLDYDEELVPMAHAHDLLAKVAHVLFPTWSSEPNAPRWRGFIPYSRIAVGDEHKAIFDVIDSWFAAENIPLDPACSDTTRLWYCPCVKPGASFEVLVGEGPLLDVDAVLVVARELEAEREAERAQARALRPPPPLPDATDKRATYVHGAITRAADNIASAHPGQRHRALNAEAYSLARPELNLSAAELDAARTSLEDAALASMGPTRAAEIRRTLRDAFKARGAA